jgi:hypothetical protein
VVKPTTRSSIAIGAWASYMKLLSVKDSAASGVNCSSSVTSAGTLNGDYKGCHAQYQALVDGSKGGADFRLALMYDLALGDFVALTLGATVNYAIIPYSIAGSTSQTGGKIVDSSDIAKGIGATANAGIGAHF